MQLRGAFAADVSGDVPVKVWPVTDTPESMFYERSIGAIAGPSGVGKSNITFKLAADFSRTYGPVIFSNLEDDPAVQKYRLEANGADMAKVLLATFKLPRDLRDLESHIAYLGAKVCIFDTTEKTLGPTGSKWGAYLADLRTVLENTDCMALFVHHTLKSVPKNADWQALLGGYTSGLGGSARTVHLVGKRPGMADQLLLVPAKDSNAPPGDAIAFDFDTVDFTMSDGRMAEIPRLSIAEKGIKVTNLADVVNVRGEASQRGPTNEKVMEAQEFLTKALANGPVPVADHYRCDSTGNLFSVGHVRMHSKADGSAGMCPCCDGSATDQAGISTLAQMAGVSNASLKRAYLNLECGSDRRGVKETSMVYRFLAETHPAWNAQELANVTMHPNATAGEFRPTIQTTI